MRLCTLMWAYLQAKILCPFINSLILPRFLACIEAFEELRN
jgi:hypothetical protein